MNIKPKVHFQFNARQYCNSRKYNYRKYDDKRKSFPVILFPGREQHHIPVVVFFLNKNKNTMTAISAISMATAMTGSCPAKKLFFVLSFSRESNTMSSARSASDV